MQSIVESVLFVFLAGNMGENRLNLLQNM